MFSHACFSLQDVPPRQLPIHFPLAFSSHDSCVERSKPFFTNHTTTSEYISMMSTTRRLCTCIGISQKTRGKSDAAAFSLKIIPKDVQLLVMSVLAKKDLSSVMRTCKDFLDLGLTELTRSGHILQYRNATSFRDFLRIQDESSSRVHALYGLSSRIIPINGGP